MLLFILTLVCSMLLTLALYLHNKGGILATRLVGFIIALNIWVFFTFLSTNIEGEVTTLVRLSFIGAIAAAYMLRSFVYSFVTGSNQRHLKYYASISILAGGLALTDLVVGSANTFIEPGGSLSTNVERSSMYIIFLSVVLMNSLSAIGSLLVHYREAPKTEKSKIKAVIFGLALTIVSLAFTNAIGPIILDLNTYPLSPLGGLLCSVVLSYAIVRHKLFDVKAAVARVMTYVLTSAVIVAVYAGGAYFLGSLTAGLDASSYQIMANVGLTALLILVYPFIKKTFNKLTNRFFFREAYDAQTFIDELNKTLVSGVELDTLLTKSALIIQENMKSSYCTFYIRKTSYLPERIIGAHRGKKDFADIETISECAKHLKTKVFDAETPHEDEINKKLAKELKKNDASALVRLVDTVDYEVNGIGYIFIGPKRSGGLYSKKDLKILEIIANELVVAVESALRFEEIEQFNVTLQKKIDDATKELRKSNEKLQALDAAKDEFISMASHQLRTPLTSVKGYISMIVDGDLGDINEQQKKMLEQAFVSSQRMVYLIADLLNVSRLRTGKFAIETHPTNLADVIEGEIAQLVPAADVRGLKLKYKKPAKFPDLNLDETKIRQVVMNFVDNAIYYTPAGGTITINLKLTKTSVECTVVDTGMGVPKKEIPHLFTKFYRAGNARQARPDGTGIGLFMAKKVIVGSGGSIVFKTKEGKGSTFGFLLPLSKIRIDEKD